MNFMLTCDIVKFAILIYKNKYFDEYALKKEQFMLIAIKTNLELDEFHKLCNEMWNFCNVADRTTMIDKLSKCVRLKIIS